MNPERTVFRPSPGGRNSGHSSRSEGNENLQAQSVRTLDTAANRPQMQPSLESAEFAAASGLNPLVNAASTLIAVFEKTQRTVSHPDVSGLHRRLADEIGLFEDNLKRAGTPPQIILSAKYCVCTALDEAVLNTPWGAQSGWSQRSLLSIFHNEIAGGEKFFDILDRVRGNPADSLDFVELVYILLSLGFRGKYRVLPRGRDALENLRADLFASIRRQRGEYERSLSPTWQGLGETRKSLTSYIPLWVVASIFGAVLILSYSGFRVWLHEASSPVVSKLEAISVYHGAAKQDSGARVSE